MDFFEHQEKARRQTRRLVLLFVLAVIGIVIAVDLLVSTVAANLSDSVGPLALPSLAWYGSHSGLMLLTSLGSASFVGMASLYRVASLRSGGGTVARSLGGTLVSPSTDDPLRRRLHNVVEEMAIASGVPVPEVYVLEQESGLNAFAAGFTTSDAAVTVTRGTLENLSRNELQGVIAHEFSHVLNGDMRLNMRLIGILFGIFAISLVGRTILRSMRHTRIRSSNSRDGGGGTAVILMVGASLAVIGYIGLFCGRLIKASVSRQREFLADASAVQFTRQTEGIAGALKKIGFGFGSVIEFNDGEEVSHMLFANGFSSISSLYATHPPIVDRIRLLEPGFDPEAYARSLEEQKAGAARQKQEDTVAREKDSEPQDAKSRLEQFMRALLVITPDAVSGAVGNPGIAHVQHAAELRQLISARLGEAIHTPAGALLLSLALLLDQDGTVRETQLKHLARSLEVSQIEEIGKLYEGITELGIQSRMPLMEMSFPVLKSRPPEQIKQLLALIDELIEVDGRVDTFEYLLSRTILSNLRDAETPQRASTRTSVRLVKSVEELGTVFSVVAHLGHEDSDLDASNAYQDGMRTLLPDSVDWPAYLPPARWAKKMDAALEKLDKMPAMVKQELVKSLTVTISHDGKVTINEAELLRAICGIIHCPLPPFLTE